MTPTHSYTHARTHVLWIELSRRTHNNNLANVVVVIFHRMWKTLNINHTHTHKLHSDCDLVLDIQKQLDSVRFLCKAQPSFYTDFYSEICNKLDRMSNHTRMWMYSRNCRIVYMDSWTPNGIPFWYVIWFKISPIWLLSINRIEIGFVHV